MLGLLGPVLIGGRPLGLAADVFSSVGVAGAWRSEALMAAVLCVDRTRWLVDERWLEQDDVDLFHLRGAWLDFGAKIGCAVQGGVGGLVVAKVRG